MTQPRMKDVAELAGVSTKTVSNVVRGWPQVSPATREKVQQALDHLGYRMNLSARTLKSGRSGIIALAVPWLDSPYFAELTSAVVRHAEDRSWTVLVDQTNGVREREMQVIKGFRGQLIDGLIFSPYALGKADIESRGLSVPMVLLGERVMDSDVDQISIDNVAAAEQVVRHLLASGHRRIAALGQQTSASGQNSRMRAEGYRNALFSAGLTPDPALQVGVDEFTRADGAAAMRRLLEVDPLPEAVFCFSDLLALGAMHVLHEHGIRVPEDVAVAGFDDIEDGRYTYPTLTTVRPDKEAIAQVAVSYLLTRLGSQSPLPTRRFTPSSELVVRASSAPRLSHALTAGSTRPI